MNNGTWCLDQKITSEHVCASLRFVGYIVALQCDRVVMATTP